MVCKTNDKAFIEIQIFQWLFTLTCGMVSCYKEVEHKKVKGQPTLPVPGVLVNTPTETQEPLKGDKVPETEKKPEQTVPAAPGKKADEPAPKAEQATPKEGKTPEAEKKPEQTIPAAPGKKADEPAPKAEQTAPKEGKSPETEKKPEQTIVAPQHRTPRRLNRVSRRGWTLWKKWDTEPKRQLIDCCTQRTVPRPGRKKSKKAADIPRREQIWSHLPMIH